MVIPRYAVILFPFLKNYLLEPIFSKPSVRLLHEYKHFLKKLTSKIRVRIVHECVVSKSDTLIAAYRTKTMVL